MIRVVIYLAELTLLVYALIDCIQTEGPRVRNLPKIGWILLILLIPVAGAVAWLIAGRPLREGGAPPDGRGRATGGPRPGGRPPMGPDDDPDFLRQLNTPPPPSRREDPPADEPSR